MFVIIKLMKIQLQPWGSGMSKSIKDNKKQKTIKAVKLIFEN